MSKEYLFSCFRSKTQNKARAIELIRGYNDPETPLKDLVDTKEHNYKSLLQWAGIRGWSDVCQLLINGYQCDPFYEDENNWTVLHNVCRNGYIDLVKYFVSKPWGMDPSKKNKDGDTPLDLSTKKDVIKYLKSLDSIRDDVNVHINAFKEAVKSKGSLTCYMAQCMTFGPPRVGKTCLFHNLLDEDLPGTPTTNTTAGSGSESTDVLAESKMVQIELKMDDARGSTVPIVVEEDGKWSPINTMKDEIAIYMKSLNHQTKLDMSKSSKPLTPEFTDDLQSDSSDAKVEPADTSSLDDAVIDAVTRHVREGNVDLSRLQLLLSKSITIFFTDTGGQPEFQEVLPVLATGPTIFILVFDLHQPLDSVYKVLYESSSKEYKVYDSCFSVRDALMQCLSSISSFHCGQSRDFSKNELMKCSAPPTKVMSIATHRDLVSKEIYAKVDNDLKESIKKATVIDGANIMEPFTKDHLVIPIDNYDRKDGSKVRKVIERVIRRGKSLYKVELPANWLCLQLNLRQRDSSTIAFSGCLKIAAKLDISREELKSCLWYLHYKTGTIRYYDQVKELEDTVILRPKILFTAVTKLIMSTFTIDDVEPSIQEKFNTLGLFKVAEVRDIFDEHKAELEISFDQFTALLQHLNILVPAHDGKHDYFLPCALVHAPVSQPTNSLHSLALLFNGGFVPKGAYSNLVGSLSKRRWSITCANCKPQLFRNKVVFSFDHAYRKHVELFQLDTRTRHQLYSHL